MTYWEIVEALGAGVAALVMLVIASLLLAFWLDEDGEDDGALLVAFAMLVAAVLSAAVCLDTFGV